MEKTNHNSKLIKLNNHSYLVDNSAPPIEGGVSIYSDILPVFTNFVDYEKEICSINHKSFGAKTIGFRELKTVISSTNHNDGTLML